MESWHRGGGSQLNNGKVVSLVAGRCRCFIPFARDPEAEPGAVLDDVAIRQELRFFSDGECCPAAAVAEFRRESAWNKASPRDFHSCD